MACRKAQQVHLLEVGRDPVPGAVRKPEPKTMFTRQEALTEDTRAAPSNPSMEIHVGAPK